MSTSVSDVINSGPAKKYSAIRQFLLSRPFEEFEPCRRLIELATNTDSTKNKGGILSKITAGQITGSGFALLGIVSAALTKFAEDKAKWIFSTFFYFVLSVMPLLGGSIGRKGFVESKHKTLTSSDTLEAVSKDSKWNEIIFENDSSRRSIEETLELVESQGVVINLYGPVGTGKSFIAETLEDKLKDMYPDKEVTTLNLTQEFLSQDMSRKGFDSFFGVKIGSGTVAQKLEGIFTHLAELHKKSNGKRLFILIADEGHALLGGSSNPANRTETQQQLGYLFDKKNKISFRSKLGSGVIFCVTHNLQSESEQEEHLLDRTDVSERIGPLEKKRKQYIRNILEALIRRKKEIKANSDSLDSVVERVNQIYESNNGEPPKVRGKTNRKIKENIERVVNGSTSTTLRALEEELVFKLSE